MIRPKATDGILWIDRMVYQRRKQKDQSHGNPTVLLEIHQLHVELYELPAQSESSPRCYYLYVSVWNRDIENTPDNTIPKRGIQKNNPLMCLCSRYDSWVFLCGAASVLSYLFKRLQKLQEFHSYSGLQRHVRVFNSSLNVVAEDFPPLYRLKWIRGKSRMTFKGIMWVFLHSLKQENGVKGIASLHEKAD